MRTNTSRVIKMKWKLYVNIWIICVNNELCTNKSVQIICIRNNIRDVLKVISWRLSEFSVFSDILKSHMSISAVTIRLRLYRDLITPELKIFDEYCKDYNRVAQFMLCHQIFNVFLQIVFPALVSFWFHIFRSFLSLSLSLPVSLSCSLLSFYE